uniref:Retrotransposon gag domain-containing protein n=1 Tax=Nyssomyia neivai TaxID=330878 RepID=A0A1L8DAH5_9DIPT
MAALVGNIPEFNQYCDWKVYLERLEQFFLVNDIPDTKRNAILISVIGNETYKTLRDLCHPQLPKDKTFEELCSLMDKQYGPQISVFRERIKFYQARQYDYETVSTWFARVKTLSVDCKFGETLEAILLDRFISGLRNPAILDRLCEETETSLTLVKAVEIAVNKESSTTDSPSYNRNNWNRPWQNRRGNNRGNRRGGRGGGCFGAPAAFCAAPEGGSEHGDMQPMV